MSEGAEVLLEKATRAVQAAKTLLKGGDVDFAVSRAYYAMFYAAEAILEVKGLHFRKHGGVHAAFGEHLVKTGIIDEQYHRWLLDAFDQRIVGDYEVECALCEDDGTQVIQHAEAFVAEIKNTLQNM